MVIQRFGGPSSNRILMSIFGIGLGCVEELRQRLQGNLQRGRPDEPLGTAAGKANDSLRSQRRSKRDGLHGGIVGGFGANQPSFADS